MTPLVYWAPGHPGTVGMLDDLEAALNTGTDGVAIDVRVDRDAEVVTTRDSLLERLHIDETQSGPSSESTLRDVLTLLEGSDVPIVLNLVEPARDRIGSTPVAIAAVELVLRRGLSERVTFVSFNHRSIAALKVAHPEVRVGIRHLARLHEAGAYARSIGAEAIQPLSILLTPDVVRDAHQHDVAVEAWTIPGLVDAGGGTDEIEAAIEEGVDVVIASTPLPHWLRKEEDR